MKDHRLPKSGFYGELATGCCKRRAPKRRYKDSLKQYLSLGHVDHHQCSTLASNRDSWRHTIHSTAVSFESTCRISLEEKRHRRKNRASTTPPKETFRCAFCNWTCLSHIGLVSRQCACSKCGESPSQIFIHEAKPGMMKTALGIWKILFLFTLFLFSSVCKSRKIFSGSSIAGALLLKYGEHLPSVFKGMQQGGFE